MYVSLKLKSVVSNEIAYEINDEWQPSHSRHERRRYIDEPYVDDVQDDDSVSESEDDDDTNDASRALLDIGRDGLAEDIELKSSGNRARLVPKTDDTDPEKLNLKLQLDFESRLMKGQSTSYNVVASCFRTADILDPVVDCTAYIEFLKTLSLHLRHDRFIFRWM